MQNRPNPLTAITVGWQIVPITATPGVDFTGPTSGTLTIPTYSSQQPVIVPVVIDGLAEPTETFQVRLTSSSAGGDISDTGIGNIWNDGLIPPDCDLSRSASLTVSLTCTTVTAMAHPPPPRPYTRTAPGPVSKLSRDLP